MHVFVAASSPPTTSPRPTTTETPTHLKDMWGSGDLNNSVYGNPSSLTIHRADKGTAFVDISVFLVSCAVSVFYFRSVE